ncbi:putative nacht and wd domain-containing protein [Diaporthe ampelina]|uniref:Putative nacht and wd domain-containing protein n=1 Tax=Diaporthe ampelina TaxID=1214573 RepID=A0A0G2FCZ7_9PEZI|nr:putative nacht and wd domain-containing protein [Diaporthe ampelina]
MQTCLDSIVDAMEQIGISLKCYEKFAHAFPDSDEVQDLLASSYKNIVCFWFKASRILSRHSLKTVIRGATRSIEKEIKTALDGLSRDSSNVMALAQATTAEQAIHKREATLRQGVIDWIKGGSYIDVRPILQDQLDLRLEGTCKWLFEDKHFLNWCNATGNGTLWYNAKPGSGKSVYAATIIDYLKKRDKKVAYFFYSFNSPQRKFGISGMRSLALQLLKFVTGLPDKVVQRYKDEIENCASGLDNIHTASHIVHELLTQCEETYVVVDGVDECLDDDITLITLHYLMKMPTYGLVKWLFTSRDYLKIRSVMEGGQAVEIKAPTESVSHDIRFYFSKYITCQHCIDKWTEGEDNFLYSKLICEALRGEGLTSDAEIEEALERYPKNLNSYYIRALEKLSEATEQQQELARDVYFIISGSTPLFVRQANM